MAQGMWTYSLPEHWYGLEDRRSGLPLRHGDDPRDLSPAQIRLRMERARAFLTTLRSDLAGLPGRPHLTERERVALGAHVFATAPLFTATLIDDMHRRPSIYLDLRVKAEQMSVRSEEAAVWHDLRGTLGALYAIAHDNYLLAQSQATSAGFAILDQIDAEVQGPAEPSLLSRRRWHGLMTARLILRRQREGRARRAAKLAPPREPTVRSPGARLRVVDLERVFRRKLAQERARAAADPAPQGE